MGKEHSRRTMEGKAIPRRDRRSRRDQRAEENGRGRKRTEERMGGGRKNATEKERKRNREGGRGCSVPENVRSIPPVRRSPRFCSRRIRTAAVVAVDIVVVVVVLV